MLRKMLRSYIYARRVKIIIAAYKIDNIYFTEKIMGNNLVQFKSWYTRVYCIFMHYINVDQENIFAYSNGTLNNGYDIVLTKCKVQF